VLNDGDLGPAGSDYWFDPRLGSDKTFVKALGDFAAKTGHPELATVPWALWGHSAGAGWGDVMSTLHPERVIAVYYRSGSAFVWTNRPVVGNNLIWSENTGVLRHSTGFFAAWLLG
jgi:pimeloyl-ACP methyl ester carboxylesterase